MVGPELPNPYLYEPIPGLLPGIPRGSTQASPLAAVVQPSWETPGTADPGLLDLRAAGLEGTIDLARLASRHHPGSPSTLREVDLSHNRVEVVTGLHALPRLLHLNLSSNALQAPRAIEALARAPRLWSLNLNHNALRAISGLENPNLRLLRLAHNHLHEITGFAPLRRLLGLDLSYNQIGVIENLDRLVHLREVRLDGNPIEKTGFGLTPLPPQLERVSLHATPLGNWMHDFNLGARQQLVFLRKLQRACIEWHARIDVAYYRSNYGFDPVRDRYPATHEWGEGCGWFRYEQDFPMTNDPGLHEAGVTIGARVSVEVPETACMIGEYRWDKSYDIAPFCQQAPPGDGSDGETNARPANITSEFQPHNRIVFKHGARETTINCVHTAVHAAPAGTLAGINDRVLSEILTTTEGRPTDLAPEDHFVALCSYVGGIAELGLAHLMGANSSTEVDATGGAFPTMIFGFNSAMVLQVLKALMILLPPEVFGKFYARLPEDCQYFGPKPPRQVPLSLLLARF